MKQAPSGPRCQTFGNRYLAVFILVLFSITVNAQRDTTRPLQLIQAEGYKWKNGVFKSSLTMPTDTLKLAVTDSGSIAYKGGKNWVWNGYIWEQSGSVSNLYPGANISIAETDSGFVISSTGGGGISDTSKWIISGADIYNKNTGNVGIGVAVPSSKLDVDGNINVTNGWGYYISNQLQLKYRPSVHDYYLFGNSGTTLSTGTYNSIIGPEAFQSNTTGYNNVTLGYHSLLQNTSGYQNAAIGAGALQNNNDGHDNIGIGTLTLKDNVTGDNNIGLGYQAFYKNQNGNNNIGIGYWSMYNNVSGNDNTAIGYFSGGQVTSSNNTAIGESSFYSGGGNYNTAIGSRAFYNGGGSNNTIIGYNAGNTGVSVGSNNTVLGSNVTLPNTASGNVIIGSGDGIKVIWSNVNHVTSLYHGASVASAATITTTGNSFHVTGTTGITSISGTSIAAGATITLIFDGALTVTDGSNLILAGNLTTTTGTTLTLKFDGTNFYELSRSIN